MVNGQWSMVNGQWSMVNGQWSMVNGQWSMVNGQWSKKIFYCILNQLPRKLFNLLLIYPGKLINDPIDSMTNDSMTIDLMTY